MKGGSLGIDFVARHDADVQRRLRPRSPTGDTAPATAVVARAAVDRPLRERRPARSASSRRASASPTSRSRRTTRSRAGRPRRPRCTLCADVDFQDPDSTGGITRDEWTSHALTRARDRADRRRRPVGNDLTSTLLRRRVAGRRRRVRHQRHGRRLDRVHGRRPLGRLRRDAGPAARRARRLGQHQRGRRRERPRAVRRLARAARRARATARCRSSKKSLTETFDAVKPLHDYTALLTNAQVGCGTKPAATPTASRPASPTTSTPARPSSAARGRRAASTTARSTGSCPQASRVDHVPNGTADATLGNATFGGGNPTADAVFTMTADGNFAIELTWDANPAQSVPGRSERPKKAIPRPGTAQELFASSPRAAGPRHVWRQPRLRVVDEVADVPAPEGELRPDRAVGVEREHRRPAPQRRRTCRV